MLVYKCMPFIPELASFIPDLTVQAWFPGSSGKQRGERAEVPVLALGRAGHHSRGTKRSQQKPFYSTRWCPGLAYGCCLMAWTRMQSGLGMEMAGHHARVPMGLQTCQSQPPKPTPSFARQWHTPSPSSLEHRHSPSDLGCDMPWQFQGRVAQPRLPAALQPLSL